MNLPYLQCGRYRYLPTDKVIRYLFLGHEEKTDHTPEDTGTGTSVPADGAPASVNTDRDEEGDFAIVGNGAGDNQGKLIFCYRVPTVT